ncbi:MAG TPA: response regulator [Opitutaceae bacterium]
MQLRRNLILLVDDDPADRHLFEEACRELQLDVIVQSVSNGAEAVAYIKGEGIYADRTRYAYPSFVITDLKMPVADGFVTLEHLKKHPQWRVIPTIVLTNSSDQNDVQKCYLLGASSYHVKPTSPEGLHRLVRLIYDYWGACERPCADPTGRHIPTLSEGKLGARFTQLE